MSRINKLLIILPCWNEAKNIRQVLQAIRDTMAATPTAYEIMVIDDGSTDGSPEIAVEFAEVLRLPINGGPATALHAGHVFALRNGFDACLHIDSDGQHPPEDIPKFIETYEKSECDIVIGSRYIASDGYQAPGLRRFAQRLIVWAALILYRIPITDPTSGFRLLGKRAATILANASSVDYQEPISIALIMGHSCTFTEVPVSMRARIHGESFLTGLTSISFMLKTYLRLLTTSRQ